ncbi:MAG: dihydroneopterin aldolase [Prevotella sp.]|nr:dihydroneopterin aldolase [Prevotella sp.]
MNSSIFINRARFYAFHGVMPQESRVGADYEVTLEVGYDFSEAMATDEVDCTISYADLYAVLERQMAVPSRLLEHVAGRIVKAIVDDYPQVEWVDLSVVKVNPPMGAHCDGAGVHLHLINDKTEK